MPKKTKRAKLLADVRRRKHHRSPAVAPHRTYENTPQAQQSEPNVYVFSSSNQASVPKPPQQTDIPENPEERKEFTAIRKDLLKTVILACVAFVAEFVLYWRFGRL